MFFSSPGQTYFVSLFSGEIRQQLHLSHGEFGSLYSLATLFSAIVLLWTGSLYDRISIRRFSTLLAVALAIGCALVASAYHVIWLFIGIFVVRHVGQGLMGLTASTSMMVFVPDHKAKANALSYTGYSFAEATLPSVLVALLLYLSWREVWWLVALVIVLLLPALFKFLLQHYQASPAADTTDTARANSQYQWTRVEVLSDPVFYLVIPGLLSQSFLYTGFMFHQIHMVAIKGWSLEHWASLYILFSTTALITGFVIGILVDRCSARRVAPWINLPMIVGLLLLANVDAFWAAILFMLFMALSTAGQAATSAPFLAERYGTKYLGSIKSLTSFTMVLFTSVSPALIGLLIDAGIDFDRLLVGGAAYASLVTATAMIGCRIAVSRQVPATTSP